MKYYGIAIFSLIVVFILQAFFSPENVFLEAGLEKGYVIWTGFVFFVLLLPILLVDKERLNPGEIFNRSIIIFGISLSCMIFAGMGKTHYANIAESSEFEMQAEFLYVEYAGSDVPSRSRRKTGFLSFLTSWFKSDYAVFVVNNELLKLDVDSLELSSEIVSQDRVKLYGTKNDNFTHYIGVKKG